jgi:hypothetical protein
VSEYSPVRAYLDPLGLVRTEHGSAWEIELVLSDDPNRQPPSLADPVCRLDAQRARGLGPRAAGARPRRLTPPQPGGKVRR